MKSFHKIKNGEHIELRTFYVQSFTSKGTGGKGWSGTVYTFKGTIEGEKGLFKTGITSNIELSTPLIQKMIDKKQMKVWYLEREGKDFVFAQKIKPTKEELIDYFWNSVILRFFIPLFLLIRLIVLYKLGRFDLPEKTENNKQNEEH